MAVGSDSEIATRPILVTAFILSTVLNIYLVTERAAPLQEREAIKQSLTAWQANSKVMIPVPDDPAIVFRRTSGTASTGDSEIGTEMDHGEHAHPQEALAALFWAILMGAAVLQIVSLCRSPLLQETVVLFVLGLIFSFILEGTDIKDSIGMWGRSYDMWMGIDPHLLLFALLPPLLTGDAMTIDTNIARKVGFQCLFLAGPTVLVAAILAATFLTYYLDWSFKLSLVTSSILCATDPVAVVALLKELGAAPYLTVMIQGESLLNDGTAMVLWSLAYRMLQGDNFTFSDVLMFLVQTVAMAVLLGLLIGYLFYLWIRFADQKLNHSSSIIQISLSLCAAYFSFIVAEGSFKISGVLSTVACALTLAHNMWPHVVSQESMRHVWHTFEFLGNSVIFFLAGSLVGKTMVEKIEAVQYGHLVVIYLVLLVIRGGLILLSRPLLQKLSMDNRPVSLRDAVVMTWGGLRGALGLALAISVQHDRAKDGSGVPQISDDDAHSVLFYVGGVALLTIVVNATTSPILVKYLGITRMTLGKQALLLRLNDQLIMYSMDRNHPPEVQRQLRSMLHRAQDHLLHEDVRQNSREGLTVDPAQSIKFWSRMPSRRVQGGRFNTKESAQTRLGSKLSSIDVFSNSDELLKSNDEVVAEFKSTQSAFRTNDNKDSSILEMLPDMDMMGSSSALIELIHGAALDLGMAKMVNETFLSLVRFRYWEQLEAGDLRPGSPEADTLLTSVEAAAGYRCDLRDYDYVDAHLESCAADLCVMVSLQKGFHNLNNSCLYNLVESTAFNLVLTCTIVANGIHILVDLNNSDAPGLRHVSWLVFDVLFTTIFLVEFILKFAHKRMTYFKDPWNVFDFVLVIFGIVGSVVGILEQVHVFEPDVQNEFGILRLAKVFRVLRLLRLVRLFRFAQELKARLKRQRISDELAGHMHIFRSLLSFIDAHTKAQKDFVFYIGKPEDHDIGGDSIDLPEVARCLLQSQSSVYRAMSKALNEETKMPAELVKRVIALDKSRKVTEELEQFVMHAYKKGVINARETESLLHPLHHNIERCMTLVRDSMDGIERNFQREDDALDSGNCRPFTFRRSGTISASQEVPADRDSRPMAVESAARVDDEQSPNGLDIPEAIPGAVLREYEDDELSC